MSDVWEVKMGKDCYGRHLGEDAEKRARDNFRMRLEARPKATYNFDLYKNGVRVDSQSSSIKGSALGAIVAKK